jgi:PD-(D/E)XK nuclease superfamily protein
VGLIEHQTNPTSEKSSGQRSRYSLCRELELRGIPHASEVALPLEYKGVQIGNGYVVDLLIDEGLIGEIKSVEKLLPIHAPCLRGAPLQLRSYSRIPSRLTRLSISRNRALKAVGTSSMMK